MSSGHICPRCGGKGNVPLVSWGGWLTILLIVFFLAAWANYYSSPLIQGAL